MFGRTDGCILALLGLFVPEMGQMVAKLVFMSLIHLRFQAMDELLHMVEKPPSNLLEDLEEETMGKLQKVQIMHFPEVTSARVAALRCFTVFDCFEHGTQGAGLQCLAISTMRFLFVLGFSVFTISLISLLFGAGSLLCSLTNIKIVTDVSVWTGSVEDCNEFHVRGGCQHTPCRKR
jgi:hypothetical protein